MEMIVKTKEIGAVKVRRETRRKPTYNVGDKVCTPDNLQGTVVNLFNVGEETSLHWDARVRLDSGALRPYRFKELSIA